MRAIKLDDPQVNNLATSISEELKRKADPCVTYIPSDEDGTCFWVYHDEDWQELAAACREWERHTTFGPTAKLLAERIEHDAG